MKSSIKKLIVIVGLLSCLMIGVVSCYIDTAKHTHEYGEEMPLGKDEKGYLFKKTCKSCGKTEENYYDALLTFIDDDAKTQAILHWEKIIDATGIKMTCAIIPGKILPTTDYDSWSSYAGWDLLERVQAKGIDFVHHTYNHKRLKTMTQEEILDDFTKSKDFFDQHGIQSDILVYPFYNYDEDVIALAKDFFSTAFAGGEKTISDVTSAPYALNRVKIEDLNRKKEITFDGGKTVICHGIKSTDALKEDLKVAEKKGDWLVYVVHAYDSPGGKYYFDEESEQSIIDFCRYIQKEQKTKIVTATEGVVAATPIK